MTGPNHIVGGYTFTGLFASIMGVNFLSDWKYIAVIFFASLLPDIDHTKSLIGKLFYPVSRLINRKYGHRTITHSLIFLFLSTSLIASFQASFFPSFHVTLLYFLAFSSHLIFDMMTVQGVPLFYPFMKNPCVIPGDPRKRMSTNNLRHETIAMCVFVVGAVSLQPLFKNGFWTNYNRLFGTMKHLSSEYNKSRDMLHVSFALMEGSQVDSLSGLVVRSNETQMVLFNDVGFRIYPGNGQLVRDIYPTHTGKKFRFESEVFQDRTATEINDVLSAFNVVSLSVSGSEYFQLYENGFPKETKSWKGAYLNDVFVKEMKSSEVVDFKPNKTISKLRDQITQIQNSNLHATIKYKSELSDYISKKNDISSEKDIIKKEILLTKYGNLKKPIQPKLNYEKQNELEAKINELEHQDILRLNQDIKDAKDEPLKLSGRYEVLIIDDDIN